MKDILEKRIAILNKCKDSTTLQAIENELCKRDIMYRFNNYCYTDKNTNLYSIDEPNVLPFIPYAYQEEAILEIWNSIVNGTMPIEQRNDLTNVFIEKSRQMGLSWLIVAIFVYWWNFHNHKYHVLSQKEDDVDKLWDMRSLFEKARFIINNLPKWMLPAWFDRKSNSANNKYMNINNPNNTAAITGESANQNASRSGTYNAILLDEFAFMNNATAINGAAASATPCRIFNSTPNGKGNEHYRMRSMAMPHKDIYWHIVAPDIKWLRYHRSEHPLYTQLRYDWKTKGMTREKIAQELEIDYDTAVVGRVYPDFAKDYIDIKYDDTKPLYVAIDNSHWGVDPNSVIVMQPNGVYRDIIDYVEYKSTPEDSANFLWWTPKSILSDTQVMFMERFMQYNYKRAVWISDPYDTKSAMGNSVILEDYRKVGINLVLPSERSKEQQILKTRTNLYKIRYNENCKDMANCILNARYPERRENSMWTWKFLLPIHDRTSHARTAMEYLVTYLLENPTAEKKSIYQDTRPVRNYITWQMMYKKSIDLKFKKV